MSKRAVFTVEVNVDPIPGAFDEGRIESDLKRVLLESIPHYNPTVTLIEFKDK